jgi:hypothetical protein
MELRTMTRQLTTGHLWPDLTVVSPAGPSRPPLAIHVFADRGVMRKRPGVDAMIADVLHAISLGTDTSGLVVAAYLLRRRDCWQAHAHTGLLQPRQFRRVGKGWQFVERFPSPPNLPTSFPLIRMAFGMKAKYPMTVRDVYDWQFECEGFKDHLAYTFAHELHHYRRYHLGLHPRGGEQAACKWALERAADAGFQVAGMRLASTRKRAEPKSVKLPKESNPDVLKRVKLAASHLSQEDLKELGRWAGERLTVAARPPRKPSPKNAHAEALRALPAGAQVIITRDSGRKLYQGQTAIKVRDLRRPSRRMAIRTPDGKEWHWPLQWLEPCKTG